MKKRAFSLVEIIIAGGIFALILGIALMQSRNTNPATLNLASNLAFHMEVRRATDKLIENLLDGTEIVKPFEGSSLPFLVFKDVVNQTRIFYLEKTASKTSGPNVLISYTNSYSGAYRPEQRKELFGNVKDISFTSLSPGVVVVSLIMVAPNGIEIPALFEIPLKNLGTVDG